jgi:hypothetical protein
MKYKIYESENCEYSYAVGETRTDKNGEHWHLCDCSHKEDAELICAALNEKDEYTTEGEFSL